MQVSLSSLSSFVTGKFNDQLAEADLELEHFREGYHCMPVMTAPVSQ